MAQERWHRVIREKTGEKPDDVLYISDPEPVDVRGVSGPNGIDLRYISVKGGHSRGLSEGVYIETNITPDTYLGSFSVRSAISARVALAFVDRTVTHEDIVWGRKGIAVQLVPAFVAPDGGIVLKAA